jgi:5-methyltetrahydrofolate--homocysteine methyltransferase
MLKKADLKNAFGRQVRGLLEGGVDGLLIETMTALEEIEIAAEAIQELSDLPILVSLAFDPAGQGFRTMMGVSPARAVERLVSCGITALGFNCGTLDMPDYVWLARELADRLTSKGVLLLAEPNAGRPRLEGSSAVYDLSPEDFAEGLEQIHHAGAVILGGCCGTTPRHLAAAVKRLRG